ncbi:hypothetical protein [Massilia sp.]|uniref:hypothetical protein n=1 Tax=Massilia sp. TaxID=1882437 RepID=UPI002899769E|nr:hypothetical protein [Massilia sp.]
MRILTIAMMALCSLLLPKQATSAAQPFDNAQRPPPKNYSGPIFRLSHNYPRSAPTPAMPWRAAIGNGRITTANAPAYAEALKAAIADDMRVLLQDYANWDAGKRGWYNEPWMGRTSQAHREARFREPLRGMYVGTEKLTTDLFKDSGLKKDFTTYVLVYYDKTAAVTLNNIWGKTAMTPRVTAASTQFAEGSIIIKAAFITADPAAWPVMRGTQAWPAYIVTNVSKTPAPTTPALTQTYLMQFDIIVKDSVAAPDTGWVFTTLVYDARVAAPGNDIWKKMVVLGAQWGNDPQADDPGVLKPRLVENWNNMAAPAYGRATLGWGERLSGPNDGAINPIWYQRPGERRPTMVAYAKNSSCMSCHSSAQWNTKAGHGSMPSFLLPSMVPPPPAYQPPPPGCHLKKDVYPACTDYVDSPVPGDATWMKWFKNREGNVAMDPGEGIVAADFDMVLTFKSLPAWFSETQNAGASPLLDLDKRGRPLGRPATAQK